MLGASTAGRPIAGAGTSIDDKLTNSRPFLCTNLYSSNARFPSFLLLNSPKSFHCLCHRNRRPKSKHSFPVVSCKSSSDRDGGEIYEADDHNNYVEAIVLIEETIRHYHLRTRRNGNQENAKWPLPFKLGPFAIQQKDPVSQVQILGSSFLRRFQAPTIFLKVSCNGDFVLPIIVGQYAVEELINSYDEYDREECPSDFQLTRDLMLKTGFEVRMVKITERVVNTYFARIVFYKPGENISYSIDARPSDAINVARRCKAPIYVNKEIVLADASRVSHGFGRMSTKSVYDVSLDSAADGPDLISEELLLVTNMNSAAKEERFIDAAMWRDKLKKLRGSTELL